ncbi:MAG: TetR/AcrR family transcriptional regulator [Dehalococcoidia bacterium]|nr:TetR/AcrR family transcriptional regulator [Dehalococcoidia bacterium]
MAIRKRQNLIVNRTAGKRLSRSQRGKQIAVARKRQITQAAYEIIAEKGYYNFTMMDIAKRAGVSSGLIHHYFRDKENMLVTLLREMQQSVRITTEQAIEEVSDPKEKLEVFMDRAFALVETQREYLYVTYDFLTQIKFNERMQRIMTKLYRGYRETMVEILREGKAKGTFKKNVDEHYTSTLFVSIMLGVELQYVIDNTSFFYKDYTTRMKNYIFDLTVK